MDSRYQNPQEILKISIRQVFLSVFHENQMLMERVVGGERDGVS